MCACTSMTKNFFYTGFIILIGHLLSTHGQGLNNPWLYRNKTQRCNCESNVQCSDQDGTCPHDKCASNYFGNNCQHANISLAMTRNPTNVPPELLDGNDTTCLNNYTGTAIFQTDNRVHFIWAYIFAESPITVNPTLTLRNPGNSNIKFYFLTLSSNSLLIKADRDVMYQQLEISGLPKDICSLEVSLGRNLALSSTPSGLPGVKRTMDGIEDKLFPFTFDNATWDTRLLNKAKINHIKLSVQVNKGCTVMHLYFTFKRSKYSSRRKQIKYITNSQSINVDVKHSVNVVKFQSIEHSSPKCVVDLYEIYIFGEFQCPKNMYGERCKRRCRKGCDRHICDPDWGCPAGCRTNWIGKWCDQRNTVTTTTAAAATTSATTTNPTTSATNTTIAATITATTSISKKGLDCSENCNRAGDCDKDTGDCLEGCKPGFYGPYCTEPCPIGTFGENCSRLCINCRESIIMNQQCDPATGRCLWGCEVGYTGDDCKEKERQGGFDILKFLSEYGQYINIACAIIIFIFVRLYIRHVRRQTNRLLKKANQPSIIESETQLPEQTEVQELPLPVPEDPSHVEGYQVVIDGVIHTTV